VLSKVAVTGGSVRDSGTDSRLTFYQVTQEALTNIRKHARALEASYASWARRPTWPPRIPAKQPQGSSLPSTAGPRRYRRPATTAGWPESAVSDRGRIPANIVEQYHAATKDPDASWHTGGPN
jgi:hypothetical protein